MEKAKFCSKCGNEKWFFVPDVKVYSEENGKIILGQACKNCDGVKIFEGKHDCHLTGHHWEPRELNDGTSYGSCISCGHSERDEWSGRPTKKYHSHGHKMYTNPRVSI